jgi:hypothetical protein
VSREARRISRELDEDPALERIVDGFDVGQPTVCLAPGVKATDPSTPNLDRRGSVVSEHRDAPAHAAGTLW